MDESVAAAILKVLAECGPQRALRLDPLAAYANARLPAYADRNAVQAHLNALEARGLVRREASPLDPAAYSYSVTAAGQALALTLH
ncbi:MAG TPA: winged helix-turn-helix transcriptional regulator [Kiritimatiellia bacterium]|nr:winged helix-turn-helix transcriptional regulator [Kiritimatiellia bacterium]